MPARGNAPGTCPRYLFRPERAEDSCALAGRTDRFRNPGRCPGLACGAALSAGIKVVQIRIHEYCWLAMYSRWLPVGQLVPGSVRNDPPRTPLCVQELNFRLADNPGTTPFNGHKRVCRDQSWRL